MVWAVSPRRWLLAHRLQHCRATFLRPAAANTRFPCVDAYATFRRRPALKSWRKASQRMRLDCPSTQVFSKSPCDVRGPRYSQFPTFSPAVPPSHRPGSLELGDLEYGDFWSQALPPSPESMLAAKKFLIDRAVLTMHEIFHKSKPHRPGSLDYERNFGIKKSHRPGSPDRRGREHGDFWSQAYPHSSESMLAAKKFLIDRAVITMHEISGPRAVRAVGAGADFWRRMCSDGQGLGASRVWRRCAEGKAPHSCTGHSHFRLIDRAVLAFAPSAGTEAHPRSRRLSQARLTA